MTMHPLTHHEMLDLVAPFVRAGYHVDLPASDRMARRVMFSPVEHAGDPGSLRVLREVLQLDQPAIGRYRLTRVITHPGGIQARLVTDGNEPAELLARVASVPLQRQFRCTGDVVIALCHRLEPPDDASSGTPCRLLLTDGEAHSEMLRLSFDVAAMKGVPADVKLFLRAADPVDLPDDLLAVLGRDWGCFKPHRGDDGCWRSTVQLRGSGEARREDAERKLQRAAEHLAATLAQPPACFHEQWRRARWAVFFRRSVPLATCVGLIAAAAAVPYMGIEQDSVIHMMLFNAPPLLFAAFFCLRELPRITAPPRPVRSEAIAWFVAPAA